MVQLAAHSTVINSLQAILVRTTKPDSIYYVYPHSSSTMLSADAMGKVSAHEYIYGFRLHKVLDVITPIGDKTNGDQLHDKFVQYMRETEPNKLEYALAPLIKAEHFVYHPMLLQSHGIEVDKHFASMTRDETIDSLPCFREAVSTDVQLRFTSHSCKANQMTSTDSIRCY